MINGFGSVYSPPLEASEDIFRRVTQGSVGNFIPETDRDVSFFETLDASLGYTYMPIINAIGNTFKYHNVTDPNYQPFIHMEGYEDYYEQLSDAKNAEHMADLKREIDDFYKSSFTAARRVWYQGKDNDNLLLSDFNQDDLPD